MFFLLKKRKKEKKTGIHHTGTGRLNEIGVFLMIAAVFCCILSMHGPFHGHQERFTASGATGLPVSPVLPEGSLRINQAETEELQQLPGIGEALAQAIILEREKHGFFYYPEDLMAVSGIGQKKLFQIVPFLDFTEKGD